MDFLADPKLGGGAGRGLADLSRATVQNNGKLVLLYRENMLSKLGEEDFSAAVRYDDTKCLVDFGKKLRAQKLINGQISTLGDAYILTIKLTDVGSAKIESFKATTCQGEVSQILDLVSPLTCQLIQDALRSEQ